MESQDIAEAFYKIVSNGLLTSWFQMPWNRLTNYLQFGWLNTQSKQSEAYSCNPNYNLGKINSSLEMESINVVKINCIKTYIKKKRLFIDRTLNLK